MSYGSPNRHPCEKLGIQVDDALLLGDIVDGVIEQRDQTGDADNGKRLTRERTEHNCC